MLTKLWFQFLGDLMTESVEILGNLANEEPPPLRRPELEKIRHAFRNADDKKKAELTTQLGEMVTAFRGRGDLKKWDVTALDAIDKCFEECFMTDGQAATWAFVPNSETNLNKYVEYCNKVDRVLAKFTGKVPLYARDWFAFYAIWEVQGYAFPMPLGTSKVISTVAGILQYMAEGVVEVSGLFDMFFERVLYTIDGRTWIHGPWVHCADGERLHPQLGCTVVHA